MVLSYYDKLTLRLFYMIIGWFTFMADPGCLSRIPDPTFFHPGSRILIKEFKYFNQGG
jgi:hypothetical protein